MPIIDPTTNKGEITMIKLHPETAKEIAKLINKINVSDLMNRDAENTKKRIYWQSEEFKAIIKLTEDYGMDTKNTRETQNVIC